MKKVLRYLVLVGLLFVMQPIVSTASAQEIVLGQIVMGGWNFCPRSTAPANGSLLAISSNEALFTLLGTNFGGDGRTTFGLPDLRGRSPVGGSDVLGTGPGLSNIGLGDKGGAETTTLTVNNLPSHSHNLPISTTKADDADPTGKTFGAGTFYTASAADTSIATAAVGGGQSVGIRSPYQGITFCIVTQGVFPSRN